MKTKEIVDFDNTDLVENLFVSGKIKSFIPNKVNLNIDKELDNLKILPKEIKNLSNKIMFLLDNTVGRRHNLYTLSQLNLLLYYYKKEKQNQLEFDFT